MQVILSAVPIIQKYVILRQNPANAFMISIANTTTTTTRLRKMEDEYYIV